MNMVFTAEHQTSRRFREILLAFVWGVTVGQSHLSCSLARLSF